MHRTDKKTLLAKLESQVETHLQLSISNFQNQPNHILLQAASNGGWSIAQCIEHLNSYGRYYLPQIEKALVNYVEVSSNTGFRSSWLGAYFTRMMLPTNTKKYKAFKGHIPAVNLDAHAVIAEFIEQQETLLRYLQQAQEVDLDKIRIPISLTKWIKLKLGDTFQFMIAHDQRHLEQAQRNLPANTSNNHLQTLA